MEAASLSIDYYCRWFIYHIWFFVEYSRTLAAKTTGLENSKEVKELQIKEADLKKKLEYYSSDEYVEK